MLALGSGITRNKPMPAYTLCLDCRALVLLGPRCQPCRRLHAAKRGTRQAQGYGATYQRNRLLVIEAQPWCSVAGCTSTRLTADHVIPLSQGGSSDLSNLRVMCLSHNAARMNTR